MAENHPDKITGAEQETPRALCHPHLYLSVPKAPAYCPWVAGVSVLQGGNRKLQYEWRVSGLTALSQADDTHRNVSWSTHSALLTCPSAGCHSRLEHPGKAPGRALQAGSWGCSPFPGAKKATTCSGCFQWMKYRTQGWEGLWFPWFTGRRYSFGRSLVDLR